MLGKWLLLCQKKKGRQDFTNSPPTHKFYPIYIYLYPSFLDFSFSTQPFFSFFSASTSVYVYHFACHLVPTHSTFWSVRGGGKSFPLTLALPIAFLRSGPKNLSVENELLWWHYRRLRDFLGVRGSISLFLCQNSDFKF